MTQHGQAHRDRLAVLNDQLREEILGYLDVSMSDTAKLRELLPDDYTPLGLVRQGSRRRHDHAVRVAGVLHQARAATPAQRPRKRPRAGEPPQRAAQRGARGRGAVRGRSCREPAATATAAPEPVAAARAAALRSRASARGRLAIEPPVGRAGGAHRAPRTTEARDHAAAARSRACSCASQPVRPQVAPRPHARERPRLRKEPGVNRR